MTDSRSIDFDGLREAAEKQGWFLTTEKLGDQSGGGYAFVCMKTRVLEDFRAQIALTRGHAIAQEYWEKSATLIRSLNKVLTPDSDELGVLKVAQQPDGRMKKEIKALTECKHPNLVPIFTHAPGEDPNWYIMKFFSGGDLAHRRPDYTGKVVEVLRRIREVAEALDVIHAKQLVHRD
ncbi:MAG: protein kinase, partial [Cystobacter sp.]